MEGRTIAVGEAHHVLLEPPPLMAFHPPRSRLPARQLQNGQPGQQLAAASPVVAAQAATGTARTPTATMARIIQRFIVRLLEGAGRNGAAPYRLGGWGRSVTHPE
jgi:hypothetical protein